MSLLSGEASSGDVTVGSQYIRPRQLVMPKCGTLVAWTGFCVGDLIHSVKGEYCDCLEVSGVSRVTGLVFCRGSRHDSNSDLGWIVD